MALENLSNEQRAVIDELLPTLRGFVAGRYAISLGGSLSKGSGDQHSDIDFYLFAEQVAPEAARAAAIRGLPGIEGEPWVGFDFEESWWGSSGNFRYKGFLVESTVRSVGRIDRVLQDCLDGKVENIPTTWNPFGFYNHCYLSDIKHAVSLEDPAGLLASWKSKIAIYPPKLKQTISAKHLPAARFWLDNPHYLSAIKRQDLVYTTSIVQSSLHHVIQLVYAANETYYGGDKKNLEAVEKMRLKPADFRQRAEKLLVAPGDVDSLEGQRVDLKALLRETEALR